MVQQLPDIGLVGGDDCLSHGHVFNELQRRSVGRGIGLKGDVEGGDVGGR
jgi:hypothetical protein